MTTDELMKCRTDLMKCVSSLESTMKHLVGTECVSKESLNVLKYSIALVHSELEKEILDDES